MLVNILVLGLVSVFVAIVVFGHILLATAIWPNLFRRRPGLQTDHTADAAGSALNQPG
jgi:hypothetical protein